MRVLVTGAAGFIGSHLCEALLEMGHEVVGVDNLYTGQISNLTYLRQWSRFEAKLHDVVDPFHIECDQIYNLACPASPVHYQRDPVKTTLASVVGVRNVLEIARSCGARILQASTSEVYGDPEVSPQREEYLGRVSSLGPRACYDEGKRCAETLVMDYTRQHGVEVRIARIFNTYGPRMDVNDGRVISNFAIQALRNDSITLYGDGSQTRSFCYVGDMVDGLINYMEVETAHTVMNLGNPEEVTIRETAEKIKDLAGSKSRIVMCPLPIDDPKRRCPAINLARNVIGFDPCISLDEGLKETIDYFRHKLSHETL